MKSLYFVLSLLILSIFINIGCDGGTGTGPLINLTPDVSLDIIKENEILVDPLGDKAIMSDDPNAFMYVVDEIRNMPHVKYVTANKDSLVVEYDWGGIDVWVDNPTPYPDNSLKTTSSDFLYRDNSSLLKSVGNKKALIINTIASDPGFSSELADLNSIETELKNAGFSVTRRNGDANKVDNFKDLDEYGIIIYNGHGGLEETESGSYYGIQTGELYDENNISEQKKIDMKNKRIEEFTVTWGTGSSKGPKSFWGITNRYLAEYTSGYPNSFFYNMACEGMKNPKTGIPPMAETLAKLGNGVYLGWTKSVNDTSTSGKSFIEKMCTGKTVGEVYGNGWPADPSQGGELKYYPLTSNAKDITIYTKNTEEF